jgi:hypothetical protein
MVVLINISKPPQMKTSSKLIVATISYAIIFFTTNVKAQTTPANAFRFGIGLEADNPTGNSALGANFVLGGTVQGRYGISNNFALTLTSGAYHYFPKTIPGTNTTYNSYGLIPVKAGIKAFFTPNLYFGAEAGVGFEITDSGWGPKRALLSPALGYANSRWDIGLRYEYLSDKIGSNGLYGLRVGFGF